MVRLRVWVVWLILFGVAFDLAVSGVLAYQEVAISHAADAAHCWDRVLDRAIVVPAISRAELRGEATRCARLIP